MYTFLKNILFHYGLSQEIGYSSLCYTIGPCCLSILNIIVCIYQPQIALFQEVSDVNMSWGHMCGWGLGNPSTGRGSWRLSPGGICDVDSRLHSSSPILASCARLTILGPCRKSWPSSIVALMEASVRIPLPCSPQLFLNGDWAKALLSFDPHAFSETLLLVHMNAVRQLFGFDLPSDEAF